MASDRLYCPECGTPNEVDASFCESCGNTLAEQAAAPSAATSAAPPPRSAPVEAHAPQPRKGTSRKLVAIVALLVVAGGAAYAFASPIKSFLGMGEAEVAVTADSVQLAPVTENITLNDNSGDGAAQFEVAPEVLENPEVQKAIVSRSTPPAPTLGPQTRPQAPPRPAPAPASSRLPQPEEPPDFPDFRAPPEAAKANRGAEVTTPPATREEPAPPARGKIAAGSVLSLKSASQICSDKTTQGARFTALVQQDVAGSNGASIPAGTSVTFVVDRLKRAGAAGEKPEFSVAPESIDLAGDRYPVSATVDAVTIKQKSKSLLGALAGAAVTAAATRAAGGDTKQTIAGAAAGGAAGAVIGNQMRGGDGCIEKNASIRITLGSDITLN